MDRQQEPGQRELDPLGQGQQEAYAVGSIGGSTGAGAGSVGGVGSTGAGSTGEGSVGAGSVDLQLDQSGWRDQWE